MGSGDETTGRLFPDQKLHASLVPEQHCKRKGEGGLRSRLVTCLTPYIAHISSEVTHLNTHTASCYKQIKNMFCSIHFQGSFQLLVAVNDVDSFFGFYKYFGEFIDVIYIEESLQPNGSFSTPQLYTGMYDKATISLSFRVSCTENYYGPNCATFCEPNDNHTCDENGSIVCRNSYYGTRCNVFCEARNDTLGHYQCSRNGGKICLEGYQDPDTNCTARKWVHCYLIYPT